MSNYAVRVEELGKLYHIGASRGAFKYKTLRESLSQSVKTSLQRLLKPKSNLNGSDTFWALKDVSFEVKKGEVIGIIGRNGSGKSTLLKILSHITEPTSGRVRLRGRVGSLLEVGTGFHPELTGRENIYLYGSILGMKRKEIDSRFDEIVAFAEVEKFLETPVKRYSSGMYVRLAFAVAAHLETEILLVDEVLAVGDAQFQKKCLGKMGAVAQEGRTVLLVSHNMAAIQNLCSEAILLNDGHMIARGNVKVVVNNYLQIMTMQAEHATSDLRPFKRSAGIRAAFVEGHLNGKPLAGRHRLMPESRLEFDLCLELTREYGGISMGIHLEDALGIRVYTASSRWELKLVRVGSGRHQILCTIEKLPLVPGQYHLTLGCYADNQALDWLERIATFEIEQSDVYGTGELPGAEQGYFLTHANWIITE